MVTSQQNLLVLIANLLLPIAIAIFSLGFFPYKPLIPGLATFEKAQNVPPRVFNKVVFMVVDALRSDFVYSNNSGFLFTQSLIRSGAAVPFTAHAGAPTVTMPRLKALTTGSIPSFLDVILNIAESDTSSTLAYQDTWLAQFRSRGEHLIMYGDDTWLKLFPGMFSRSDGTTSFFVSDFTEVDTNVTRHIPRELLRDDWSALIMHYLGLDHIGHKSGPRSPHMEAKQHEMDSVVTQVYEAIVREDHLQSTLFVLCGDHGMNDAGNHGGSSEGETSPALLFISPKFQEIKPKRESPLITSNGLQYYHTVDQTDIAPTLAGLLGLPIPLNSLGVFIPELLEMWSLGSQRAQMLLENSRQLLNIVKQTFPSYKFEPEITQINCDSAAQTNLEEVQCAWLQAKGLANRFDTTHGNDDHSELEPALLHFLRTSQKLMSGAASNYNLEYLHLGIFVTSLAVLFSLPATFRVLRKYKYPGAFLLLSILSYSSLMFASSYVEEEQQFWYWIFMGWTLYLHIKSSRSLDRGHSTMYKIGRQGHGFTLAQTGAIGLAILHRIVRRWNQTGQKFSAEPDIAREFFPAHQDSLWVLVGLTYIDIYFHLSATLRSSLLLRLLASTVVIAAFTFKLVFAIAESPELVIGSFFKPMVRWLDGVPLVLSARLVFTGVFLFLLLGALARTGNTKSPMKEFPLSSAFHEALTLLLITQSRVTNVPIFLVLRLQLNLITSMDLTGIELTITSLFMQYITFFAFGGSNSISSVDLSNAYNGIRSYNIILVGILTFTSNWAGPIWWISATRLLRSRKTWNESQSHMTLLTFFVATTLGSVMAACTALRTHLFIWTVFSPKYLYTISWVLINHFVVNLLGEIPLLFSRTRQ